MIDKDILKERLLDYLSSESVMGSHAIPYATISGSTSVGVSQRDSDLDILGWTLPPLELLYPHVAGYIPGYGDPAPTCEPSCRRHNIKDDTINENGVDLNFHTLPRFLTLAERGHIEVMGSLFAKDEHVLLCDHIGPIVRRNRHLFVNQEFGAGLRRALTLSKSRKERGKNSKSDTYARKKNFVLFKDMYVVKSILRNRVVELTECEIAHLEYIRTDGPLEVDVRLGDRVIDSIEHIKKKMKLSPVPDGEGIKELLRYCITEFYGDILGF